MDYQALAQVLPLSPSHWNNQHVQLWLHFIHLPTLAQPFSTPPINRQQQHPRTNPPLPQRTTTNSLRRQQQHHQTQDYSLDQRGAPLI